MQVFNLSYNDADRRNSVYEITGKPYKFFQSTRMGGTGSPPLFLQSGPPEVMQLLNQTYDRKYCNIELLRSGIMFRFKSRHENYGLPIAMQDIRKIGWQRQDEGSKSGPRLLDISFNSSEKLTFLVKPHEQPGIVRFFSKAPFSGKASL
ncbi:MAG: hypothetical protein ACOCX8_02275 [Bacteroidota bacterium]